MSFGASAIRLRQLQRAASIRPRLTVVFMSRFGGQLGKHALWEEYRRDWSSNDPFVGSTPPRTGTPQGLGAYKPGLHLLLLCRVVRRVGAASSWGGDLSNRKELLAWR